MGFTRSRPPSPLQAMIGESTEEFHTALDGEGGPGLPSSRRCSAGVQLTPTTTTSWLENTLTTLAMTTVPPRPETSWPDTDLPFERRRTHQVEKQAQAHTQLPYVEQEVVQQRNKLVGGQTTAMI
jgi:hypothetical protein